MKKLWTSLFAGSLLLQLCGFFLLDRFLGAGAVTASSNVVSTQEANGTATAAPEPAEPQIEPPSSSEDVRVYDIDPSGKHIATSNSRDQVIVKDAKGAVEALFTLEDVHFLQWMDNGSTLLYFRNKYGMTEFGVYKVKEAELLPLQDLNSSNVQIEQVYVSPYSQSINMLYEQDGQMYVGYYEAVGGFRSRSLGNIMPTDTTFDPKKETLSIHEADGTVWDFTSGRMKQRVDDTEQFQDKEIPNHIVETE